ncbi:hypothetical protein NE857_22685 [Nocardiopsis exhalans]|uniref:Uncharacterized protein n=1 Tax=Nocardiopsis exhalans TaxID=163604 RepID=A0ABY5D1D5_9ACTN|nr:hypothetical protein [Nocardiopsis exhalans]USY18119.1 hypothetical protein NE857_22685 [Nocardiopsis exhalans]
MGVRKPGVRRAVTGDGPRRTAPVWLGYAAAAAGLLLGVAHLLVTGWFAISGQQEVSPGYLVWMIGPLVVTLGLAAAALALVRPGAGRAPRRYLVWVTGTVALLSFLLSAVGFAPLFFGADPASLFLGPGPYALPGAVLFGALTLSARPARGRNPLAGPAARPPGNAPGSGRTPA